MDPRAIEMYRQHNTELWGKGRSFDMRDIKKAFGDQSTIFNSIEDGISILDRDLNVLNINFTLRSWYPGRQSFVGKKCFYVYHDRTEPCENCPILKTLKDGKAHRDIVSYYICSIKAAGWHELQAYPIIDGGEIVGVVEYVKDITYELDLYSKINAIESSVAHFKEQNELLKMYLSQMDSEKHNIEKNITANIQKYVKPLIGQIKDTVNEPPVAYDLVSFLETLLQNITAPYMDDSAALADFTSREIQILSQIKNGKTSKEIADAMCLSTKTIDFHRANIRKKLGLSRSDNLRSHIMKRRMPLE